ncbi:MULTISPECIES: hypothetical protein [unclassified Mesorhizobium]|uniref:hypothetical protein n=1 Tax=unclassified Mesorhizobium TaxID=325217 RepID=UPI003337FB7A
MPKGWHVTFPEGNRVRVFKVGIADQDEAVRAATKGRAVEGLAVLPLKDSEFEQLAMKEGQIIESGQIN